MATPSARSDGPRQRPMAHSPTSQAASKASGATMRPATSDASPVTGPGQVALPSWSLTTRDDEGNQEDWVNEAVCGAHRARQGCGARRPRSQSAPVIDRRPGGVTALQHQPTVGGRERGRSPWRTRPPANVTGARGRDRGRDDDQPFPVRLEERAGPGQVGANASFEVGGRQRRIQASVLAAERAASASPRSSACGVARRSPRSHASSERSRRSAATTASWASSSGAVSVPRDEPAPRRRSAPCRARSPCASGSRPSRRRRRGSRRGSATRRGAWAAATGAG